MKRVMLAMAVAVLAWGCKASLERASPSGERGEAVFKFSSAPCPGYEVEIYEDLRGRFTGSQDTQEQGVGWFTLTPEKLQALLALPVENPEHGASSKCSFDIVQCIKVEARRGVERTLSCLCGNAIGSTESELLRLTGMSAAGAPRQKCPTVGGG